MKIILALFVVMSFIFSPLHTHAATQDFCSSEDLQITTQAKKETIRSEFRTQNKLVNDYSHLNAEKQATTSEIIQSIKDKKLTVRSDFRTQNKLVNDYSHLNGEK
jgi:hypothetical protein